MSLTIQRIERSQLKAIMNVVIIPIFLVLIMKNIFFMIAWWLFVSIVYKYVQKNKKTNRYYFNRYLLRINALFAILSILLLLIILF